MPSILPYRAEYATKTETRCHECRLLIRRDRLQIGIMQQSMTDDFMQSRWYDMECFFKIRRPISEDFIYGFANLRYSHQMEIRKNFGIDVNDTMMQSPEKKRNTINVELEKQIEIQNNEFFTIYDKLKGFNECDDVRVTGHDPLLSSDLKDILKANNQYVPKHFTETLNHLSDIICFGALAPCSVCKEGKFVFRNSVYCCTGYDSEWSSCINTVKEPERVQIKIPKKYEEKFNIKGIDLKIRSRILRDVAEFSEDDFEMHTKQPLFNMEFFIFGETRMSREHIENKIHAMGGKIASKIHKNLAAVISNADEVKGCTGMIAEAFMHRIQVIPDDFLNEVMDNDPIELIVKKDLTKWGKDPYERMPERKAKRQSSLNNFSRWNYYNSDPNTDETNKGTIYCKGNLRYEAVLNFIDISSNKNTYFKLQLLEFSHGNEYAVSESLGRIGTSVGKTNKKHYASLDLAQLEFTKIYLEKTGNEFNTINFVKKPGLYNQVNVGNLTLIEVNRNHAPTKLTKSLYELMELLYSDDAVFKSTLIAFCFDMDSMPLGKLNKLQIQIAMNVLGEISAVQNSENVNKVIAVSNMFYSCFPHNFGLRRPPIINTSEMIQDKINMLQHLLEKELKYESLISESNQETNLLDLCYEHLQDSAEITMLNKSSGMYAQICDYIKNTQLHDVSLPHFYPGACEVEEIFEVLRHEELFRYEPYEQNFNRQLLFHGTRIENFVNILTNGLKISPPKAIFTGSAFGKGIYFSDSVSKSAAYCRSKNGVGLVLLCEVAAGMTDVRYKYDNKKLIDHCESVQALGKYYPHPLHIRPDGLKIPNGTLIQRNEDTGGITFNEFVVFDEARVKIRYLVKLKFNQKKSD